MATNITVDESVTVVNVDGSTSVSNGSTIITIANDQGPQGATGTNGTNGVGVPTGGTTGKVLTKTADGDYVTGWVTPNAGTVTSVTGVAPISVATGTTTPAITIADATTSVKGAVQLTDSTLSTSTTTAATPNSVKLLPILMH